MLINKISMRFCKLSYIMRFPSFWHRWWYWGASMRTKRGHGLQPNELMESKNKSILQVWTQQQWAGNMLAHSELISIENTVIYCTQHTSLTLYVASRIQPNCLIQTLLWFRENAYPNKTTLVNIWLMPPTIFSPRYIDPICLRPVHTCRKHAELHAGREKRCAVWANSFINLTF